MIIEYRNNKIRKLCEDPELAVRVLGQDCTHILYRRLKQLKNSRLSELIRFRIGDCHALSGDRLGQYAMSLSQPLRVVFRTNAQETAIILEIVDYHR